MIFLVHASIVLSYEYKDKDCMFISLFCPRLQPSFPCFPRALILIFAFDEVISLGHKENVTVAQVKQHCEMESHEEKLHKLVLQSKINETKDHKKREASEIEKTRF